MRDRCCLITGQAAVKRARGGNFTGLEVAHIFPLMGVGVVSADLCHGIHPSISLLTCSQNGQHPCQRLLGRKYLLIRLQIVLTMLSFSEQMFTVYSMTINGAYGYVSSTLCSAL
jgi:hypothetical protein